MSVRPIIKRIIGILGRTGAISRIFNLKYSGEVFSLNDLYKQGHWSKRSNLKKKYANIFIKLAEESNLKFCNKFIIVVFFNTRHDTDNLVGFTKVFVDTMKNHGYAKDDDKRFYRGLCIFPDETLKPGEVQILILSNG